MEAGAGADNFPISGGVSDYTFWMAVSVEGAETDPENDFWSLFRLHSVSFLRVPRYKPKLGPVSVFD